MKVAFGYEKNNPARRAGEKNNLAPILSEKIFWPRPKTQAPPPPPLNIKWTVPNLKKERNAVWHIPTGTQHFYIMSAIV